MEKIGKFFGGNFSKRTLIHYSIPIGMGLFYLFLSISRLLFPYVESYPYNWTTSMISRLGWPEVNTIGWIFFSLAFVILGFLSIPLGAYYYRRFSPLNKIAAKFIRLFLYCMSLSLILLGLIPNFETEDRIFMIIHGINAIILLGGGFLMFLISFYLILKEYFAKEHSVFNFPKKLVMLYILIGIYEIICVTMLFISMARYGKFGGHYIHDPSIPLFLSAPLWEWQTMVLLLILIVLPCYIFPNEIEYKR